MSKVSYKVQCGQSTVQYESDFEYRSQERIEELTRLVVEMEVIRLGVISTGVRAIIDEYEVKP